MTRGRPLTHNPIPLLAFVALASVVPSFAVDLEPIVTRLESESAGDRLSALRTLVTIKAPPLVARPLLVPLLRDPSDDVRVELASATAELLGERGIGLLDRLARDHQPRVRESAVRAVCRMWNSSRGRLSCVTAFEDPDSAVRAEVIRTLRETFPRDVAAAALFRRALRDDSPTVQRAAVFGCQAARDEAAVEDLLRVARSSSDLAAVPAAAEALPSIGTPDAVAALASLLPGSGAGDGPSPEVRAAATLALARMRAPQAPGLLRGLLDDPDATVLLAAMEGLLRLWDRDAIPAIAARLDHPDPRVRRFALRALGKFADPSTAQDVRRVMIGDRESVVRASAALTYAAVLGPRAAPGLGELRRDPERLVRLEAVSALSGLGPPACATLATFLADPSAEVRTVVVNGIGQTGDRTHVPLLARAGRTRNAQVRAAVARALGRIRDPSGIAVLAELARDPDPGVRANAASSLGAIGGSAASQTLKTLARDPVPRVRSAAVRALARARTR